MTSLTDLDEVVDVVIGVDTHVATHSAAAINATTGSALGEITVEATIDGYVQLVEFAGEHAVLRAWAIEGAGGHGARLARHLEGLDEIVVELDRPKRAHRRNGAKSGPLDAIRQRVRRWPDLGSVLRVAAVIVRRCRCCGRAPLRGARCD